LALKAETFSQRNLYTNIKKWICSSSKKEIGKFLTVRPFFKKRIFYDRVLMLSCVFLSTGDAVEQPRPQGHRTHPEVPGKDRQERGGEEAR
jgi:hypothetical protein